MKKLLKGSFAFSLVELMISLITISIIAAAFTPVISKRLKSGDLTLGMGSAKLEFSTKCDYFQQEDDETNPCKLCNVATDPPSCILCRRECSEGETLRKDTCTCIACNDPEYGLGDDCTSCKWSDNNLICKQCPNGKKVGTDGKCADCSPNKMCDGEKEVNCPDGNYCINGQPHECLSGHSTDGICNCIDNCNSCNNNQDGSCDDNGCTDGYTNVGGSCQPIASGVDYVNVDGVLWTAKNAGDSGGLELPNSVKTCTVRSSCSYGGTTPTCWNGKTSDNCSTGTGANGYSGCNRTVCNWYAANLICQNAGMSLPENEQFQALRKKERNKLTSKKEYKLQNNIIRINNRVSN